MSVKCVFNNNLLERETILIIVNCLSLKIVAKKLIIRLYFFDIVCIFLLNRDFFRNNLLKYPYVNKRRIYFDGLVHR